MIKHIFSSILCRAALALSLAGSCGLASAGVIHVTLDTSGFGVSTGFLDLQLSASSGVPLATAAVSNIAGFDPAAVSDMWGVTPLGNGYKFRNDTVNDLLYAVGFGGALSFDLTFEGDYDPVGINYESHFLVTAFDETFAPLGAYNPANLSLLDISWTPSATPGGNGGIGVGVNDPGAVTAVPEPSDWLLTGTGLALMLLVARRRRATAPAAPQGHLLAA